MVRVLVILNKYLTVAGIENPSLPGKTFPTVFFCDKILCFSRRDAL